VTRSFERGERDEAGAVGEVRREPVGELERQPGLADPAGAGEGEQADLWVGQELGGGGEVMVATQQGRRGDREQWCGERRRWYGRGTRRCLELQRRVVGQDRRLEALELRAGIEAQILDQRMASALVGLERVGLSAAAVEREHELRVQPLAVGVLGREAKGSDPFRFR
jgi:hypothetical protein